MEQIIAAETCRNLYADLRKKASALQVLTDSSGQAESLISESVVDVVYATESTTFVQEVCLAMFQRYLEVLAGLSTELKAKICFEEPDKHWYDDCKTFQALSEKASSTISVPGNNDLKKFLASYKEVSSFDVFRHTFKHRVRHAFRAWRIRLFKTYGVTMRLAIG